MNNLAFFNKLIAFTALTYFIRLALSSQVPLSEHALIKDEPVRSSKQPNIVFILTDDQDARLGSLDYMQNVQKSIIGEGINLKNHFGTVALCCPGRATLLRGQAAHNTNLTHVGGPGGGYPKFLATGEWKDYLPVWLKKAGYTTAYMGKFMNGYALGNYHIPPPGWDWTDILVQPYIYDFNNVVMSQNGERPLHYKSFHQTDVLRIKALDHLEQLSSQPEPFFFEIAPASPHVVIGGYPTVPLARHMFDFRNVTAPRLPNYNPADEFQKQKPAWLTNLPEMSESVVGFTDDMMRARVQGLQGTDEIVEDVVELLERKGILDETYIIYSTDNGFHLGNHRVPGGKGLPYIEDVNLPFAVRGPGIPAGRVSTIPSTHVDVAPTILDIAGLPEDQWPPFVDGRSLLREWQSQSDDDISDGDVSREILNVEFWGSTVAPAGVWTQRISDNSYKSLRIVDEKQGYLFNRWCYSNQTELYDTTKDPYELTNLALNASSETQRLMNRLSALLLVTKSCAEESCRKPWDVLRSDYCANHASSHPHCETDTFTSLSEALDPKYDTFFSSLPHFGFQSCRNVQLAANEGPYYPPESADLGQKYRERSEDFAIWRTAPAKRVCGGDRPHGNLRQRHMNLKHLMMNARELTDEEIGVRIEDCWSGDVCAEEMGDDA